MIPNSHSISTKSPCRLVSKRFTHLSSMNRGNLSFYGPTAALVHKSTGMAGETSPPRRLSASAALQVLHDNPALLQEDNMLPMGMKVASTRRRFSHISTGSNASTSKRKDSLNDVTKKSSSLMNDSSSVTGTTISISDPTNTGGGSISNNQRPTAARRRSSRKSINGLVIEIDLDDESECTMFQECEDYEEDWRPTLKREDSNESLEELRTRLEAVEVERRKNQQLPKHDEMGLGPECIRKQYIEALESSTRDSFCNGSVGTGTWSLRGIPEHCQAGSQQGGDEEDAEDDRHEENDDEASAHTGLSPLTERRSTIRSSIHGLVLQYDWTSGSELEDEGEDDNDNEEQEARAGY